MVVSIFANTRGIKELLVLYIIDLLQSLDGDGQWSSLTNDIDIATDQWPAKAINCLSLINSR